jgi:hypothetical protein
MVAGLQADVTVAGHLSQLPDETELERIEAWIGSVDAETVSHRRGLSSQLVVGPSDARLGGLSSANSPEPLLSRVESVVERKVHRMRDSHARWLRLTVLNGLWPFTPWGRLPMSTEKVEALAGVLRRIPGIATIDGVVMSSAAALYAGDLDGANAQIDGAFGASVAIEPLRARETIAVATNETGIGALDSWETLVRSEADWCAWALDVYGLPTLDQILDQRLDR